MTLQPPYKAGKILRAHGVKGELLATLLQPELFRDYIFEMIFMQQSGGLVPFFIKSFSFTPSKNTLLLTVEDVNDIKSASRFQDLDFYLDAATLPKPDDKSFFLDELEGFVLIDAEKGELGPIAEIMELPMQHLFRVEHQGKDILIPAAKDIIQTIDRKARKVYIQAPQGLIDIYLQPSGDEEE